MSKTNFTCDTGNASWNGEETGITVTIPTGDNFGVLEADEMLCGQRVDLSVRITPRDGEDPKQKKLVDDAHAKVRVLTDVSGYSRSEGEVTFRVKIPKDKMNGFHSDDFGPAKAILTVHGWEPIPEKAKVKSKPANGQQTFDSHEDTGPTPKTPESAAAPAASNAKKSRGKKPQFVESPTGKTAFDKSSIAPDGTDLSELANARARAKKPPSLEWTAGFEIGCQAGLLDKDVDPPPKLKGDKLQGWKDGYLITRAQK